MPIANHELPLIALPQSLIPWAMRRIVDAWFSLVNTVYFYRVRID
ncbi:MAG TPA: hypothetical protein VN878_00965 [Usitatibacter sp.]|nr:hypothetical protein [Usitatibacter sp.]